MTTLLEIQPLLDTWQSASWDEFVRLADDPQSGKLKCYYYDGKMRFEPMSTGADHSKNHMTINMGIGLYTMVRGIQANGHDGCSYRKIGMDEFQPDISYYVNEATDAIPWGTRVVNLDEYPIPNLVIEISDTSLVDDLGTKRLQYEDLRIPEYWIVNVQAMQILAFAIGPDGTTQRIQESRVLGGLRLAILEEALVRSRGESQSVTNSWLMQQFQA
jgi:Uma2 family endonuclease